MSQAESIASAGSSEHGSKRKRSESESSYSATEVAVVREATAPIGDEAEVESGEPEESGEASQAAQQPPQAEEKVAAEDKPAAQSDSNEIAPSDDASQPMETIVVAPPPAAAVITSPPHSPPQADVPQRKRKRRRTAAEKMMEEAAPAAEKMMEEAPPAAEKVVEEAPPAAMETAATPSESVAEQPTPPTTVQKPPQRRRQQKTIEPVAQPTDAEAAVAATIDAHSANIRSVIPALVAELITVAAPTVAPAPCAQPAAPTENATEPYDPRSSFTWTNMAAAVLQREAVLCGGAVDESSCGDLNAAVQWLDGLLLQCVRQLQPTLRPYDPYNKNSHVAPTLFVVKLDTNAHEVMTLQGLEELGGKLRLRYTGADGSMRYLYVVEHINDGRLLTMRKMMSLPHVELRGASPQEAQAIWRETVKPDMINNFPGFAAQVETGKKDQSFEIFNNMQSETENRSSGDICTGKHLQGAPAQPFLVYIRALLDAGADSVTPGDLPSAKFHQYVKHGLFGARTPEPARPHLILHGCDQADSDTVLYFLHTYVFGRACSVIVNNAEALRKRREKHLPDVIHLLAIRNLEPDDIMQLSIDKPKSYKFFSWHEISKPESPYESPYDYPWDNIFLPKLREYYQVPAAARRRARGDIDASRVIKFIGAAPGPILSLAGTPPFTAAPCLLLSCVASLNGDKNLLATCGLEKTVTLEQLRTAILDQDMADQYLFYLGMTVFATK